MPLSAPIETDVHDTLELPIAALRAAQAGWQARPLRERLAVVKEARFRLADCAMELAAAIDLPQRRDHAESLAAEVMPLADAMKFLERNAVKLLAPRKAAKQDRPSWGRGLQVVTHREPFGVVLIIGTWNYPLFLTGVQLLQATVAGNAVLVKPGVLGRNVIQRLVKILEESGLPPLLVHVAPEDTIWAQRAIQSGVDKVCFTGSADTGRKVLSQLSQQAIPSVMELSGNDAVFVLPSADLDRVANCLVFGSQINSGATCIAPRRIYATAESMLAIKQQLLAKLQDLPPVPVHPHAGRLAADFMSNEPGIRRLLPESWTAWQEGDDFPISVLEVSQPDHPILYSDLFAPVISLIQVPDLEVALRQDAACPYALGASVFGRPDEAKRFGSRVDAGCVVINDLVAPTADPRVAFGGRRQSGFGVTRGAEGLLEMTQIKSVVVQTSNWLPHLDPPIPELAPMLVDLLRLSHGRGKTKWQAMQSLLKTGRAYWQSSRQRP